MVYRIEQPEPPRGSTAWGAQQFMRYLDARERAAQRQQLLRMVRRPIGENTGNLQLASALGTAGGLTPTFGGAATGSGALGISGGGRRHNGSDWAFEDLWPFERPNSCPAPEQDFSEPLSGFPDQSDDLQLDSPVAPAPLPEGLTRPPALPPLSPERPEPMVRLSLQDIVDRFIDAGILIRAETESTRQDNQDIIDMVKQAMESCGWKAKHVGGAGEKETYIGHPDNPHSTKGGHYLDGSVEGTSPDGTSRMYTFNTAQELKRATAEVRWVAYERRAEIAIRFLKNTVDKLLKWRFDVYPKSRGMDRETWRESVRPYVQEAVRALLGC